MADQISLDVDELNALADKLDGLDSQLSGDEKALLLAVFQVAGAAAGALASDEVQGYSFSFGAPQVPLSEGFRNAFNPGVGGGAPGRSIIIDMGADGEDIGHIGSGGIHVNGG